MAARRAPPEKAKKGYSSDSRAAVAESASKGRGEEGEKSR